MTFTTNPTEKMTKIYIDLSICAYNEFAYAPIHIDNQVCHDWINYRFVSLEDNEVGEITEDNYLAKIILWAKNNGFEILQIFLDGQVITEEIIERHLDYEIAKELERKASVNTIKGNCLKHYTFEFYDRDNKEICTYTDVAQTEEDALKNIFECHDSSNLNTLQDIYFYLYEVCYCDLLSISIRTI